MFHKYASPIQFLLYSKWKWHRIVNRKQSVPFNDEKLHEIRNTSQKALSLNIQSNQITSLIFFVLFIHCFFLFIFYAYFSHNCTHGIRFFIIIRITFFLTLALSCFLSLSLSLSHSHSLSLSLSLSFSRFSSALQEYTKSLNCIEWKKWRHHLFLRLFPISFTSSSRFFVFLSPFFFRLLLHSIFLFLINTRCPNLKKVEMYNNIIYVQSKIPRKNIIHVFSVWD